MKNILVLCTGNSCRSQMAEGYLRHFAKKTTTVYSAGVETHRLNPNAVAIMKEDTIVDISNHLDEYVGVSFDYIITVCDHAKEQCPFFPGETERLHHNFFDPSKVKGTENEIHEAFVKSRNEIKAYCKAFILKKDL